MGGMPEPVRQLVEQLTQWAQAQPDVLALALVGSHARGAARPDSDVDLVLITTRPEEYLGDTRWAERFGRVRRCQVEDYGMLTSMRVWYEAGPEVEYGITSEAWAALPLDEGTQRVIEDGMVVLFERGHLLSRHTPGQEHRG